MELNFVAILLGRYGQSSHLPSHSRTIDSGHLVLTISRPGVGNRPDLPFYHRVYLRSLVDLRVFIGLLAMRDTVAAI